MEEFQLILGGMMSDVTCQHGRPPGAICPHCMSVVVVKEADGKTNLEQQERDMTRTLGERTKLEEGNPKKKDTPLVEMQLVDSGMLKLSIQDGAKSLELITWHGEPSVIVDGKFVLRHSMLARTVARGTEVTDA